MRPAGPQKPSVFALRPPTLLDHFAADLQRIVFCKSAADAPLRKSCSECPFPRSLFPIRTVRERYHANMANLASSQTRPIADGTSPGRRLGRVVVLAWGPLRSSSVHSGAAWRHKPFAPVPRSGPRDHPPD